MTTSPGLPLTEVFSTIQGEGPATGRPATFIRFGGCNLSCSWCDTPYTWDAKRFDLHEEISRRPVEDVLAAVDTGIAVLTGGEPLLHQHSADFEKLLKGLHYRRVQVHIETNGTIAVAARTRATLGLAVVSPKLDHAAAGARTGINPWAPKVLESYVPLAREGRAILKWVVQTEADCDQALARSAAVGFPGDAIWLMPEGRSVDALQARWPMVAAYAARRRVNASHRLHVLAWGDERGH